MGSIPDPIFKKRLPKISWQKIYEREYGVQYSEVAVSLLAKASYHFPKTSIDQVVIPSDGHNTAFYIDEISWVKLVEGLNEKYTSHVKKLEEYEKQFFYDGKNYLSLAKKISRLDLKDLTNKELLSLFFEHQGKRDRYSTFAWSAFILNNYVSDRATTILDKYIEKHGKEDSKQEIHDALFQPEKKAAVLQLQDEVAKYRGKITEKQFENLFERFKWLSCLDIHNKPWAKNEFRDHLKSLVTPPRKKKIIFAKFANDLEISPKDLEYLLMAKRFVYIKDARDDYRRESVFYAQPLFVELAHRMLIEPEDTSYLQTSEIVSFLQGKNLISKQTIAQRKVKFVLYLDTKMNLVCLQGNQVNKALKMLKLLEKESKTQDITGRVASKGLAKGKVAVVKGVKDLDKVQVGNILVAVTTHLDYVPAMRRSVAIITDEGGITSHAAIVSREFGIPCIVGAKVATKLLKDGDTVEVDANSGVVKILT